ncbi:MAG TPA: DUF885 family protein, partial [Candidatus Kapabacteria bacterium]|nr:DUF885 family protein [Candidatus Kapabacteria bacterium]
MKRHRTAFVFQPRTAFAVFVVLTLVLPRQISAQHIVNPNELTPTLYELLDSEWAGLMRESPEWATGIGYPGENDRWSDISEEGNIRRRDQMSEFLGTLELGNRINYLDDDDSRLDYEFARRWASDALDGYRFHDELLPISQIYGVQLDIPSTLDRQPHKSVQDYQDIFSRLSAIPTLIEQTIVLMQHGIDRKITQPKIIMRDVPEQILELIPPDSVRTPLLSAFYDLPESLPATTRLEL